jgi:hypothetical protein
VPATLLAGLVLALPATARANYFPAAAVDGPSADIQRLGGLDVASDGSGALVYLKNAGGIPRVFASRLAGGTWQPAEQLDVGLAAPATAAVVAAGTGGRDAAVFVEGGAVFATVRPAGATAWSPPALLAGSGSDPSVSMSIHGEAYATWTAPGAAGVPNVFAAQMARTANVFTPIAQPLDVDPTQPGGTGTLRSKVVATADGTGIAVWGEMGEGISHVYVRRILGPTLSLYPQEATLAAEPVTGAAGGSADEPDIAVRDDPSFAWLVFREAFADGSHVVTRPLVGSLLDPGQVLVGSENAGNPHITVNSAGDGIATAAGADDFAALGNVLHDATWGPLTRLDTPPSGVLPTPLATFPDGGFPTVSWIQDPALDDGAATVHSRQWEVVASKRTVPKPDADVTVSNPALGPVDPDLGFDTSGDRVGDVAIGFVQGTPDARSIVVAFFDRAPGAFTLNTSSRFKRTATPVLSWAAARDLWGAVTYTVTVDNIVIGSTQSTTFTPTTPLPDGIHTWRVTATDVRGQTINSTTFKTLRLDTTPPVATIAFSGKKKKGKPITITVRAQDLMQTVLPTATKKRKGTKQTPAPTTTTTPAPPPPPVPKGKPGASGVATITLSFDDGTPPVTGNGTRLTVRHVFRHSGTHVVAAVATDKAGSQSQKITRQIRLGK